MKKIAHYKKYLLIGAIAFFVILAPFPLNSKVSLAQTQTPAPAPATPPAPAPGNPSSANNSAPPANQAPDLYACAASGSTATCEVYLAAYVVNGVIALGIELAAFFTTIALQANGLVFSSPTVTIGFSVALAIANLGFVLGIIIVALATIIRNQTYGIKQILWKLVIMAIFVNFGLVIAAPIVGLSDSMSNYFINAISPGGAANGYSGFVGTLTGAFQPQLTLQAPTAASTAQGIVCNTLAGTVGLSGICNAVAKSVTGIDTSDHFWQTLMAIVFSIILSLLILVTMTALAVLLLVRYVALGILMVLLPLAWLSWVFPKFNNNFSKWWSEFVRWTFFPPLALFFLYLAFQTAAQTTNGTAYLQQAAALPANAVQGSAGAIATTTGVANPIQAAADEILLVSLTIGGLLAASSLAGKAGGIAVETATSGGKMLGGYIGKRTKKGARTAFNAVGGKEVVRNMRTGSIVPQALKKVGLFGVAQRATGAAGRALQPHLSNKEELEAAKKKVPESAKEIQENLLNSGMSNEDRLAHVAKLIDKGELTVDSMVASQRAIDFLNSRPNDIRNYGLEKSEKDADNLVGSNKAMRDAEREIKKLADAGVDTSAAVESLQTKTEEFLKGLGPKDAAKINSDAIFKNPTSPMARALSRGLFNVANQLTAKTLPKMKSLALQNFYNLYKGVKDDELVKIDNNAGLLAAAKIEAKKNVLKKWSNFEKAHNNNATGFSTGDSGSTPPSPAPSKP